MLFHICASTYSSITKQNLRLKSSGEFKIVQFTDLHFGENPDSDWGPRQDKETKIALHRLLELEDASTVDLVVLSGDQLTGLNIDANATDVWDGIIAVLDEANVPHTAILGNHDAEPQTGDQSDPGAKTNRTQLIQHDSSLKSSYTQVGPDDLSPAASVYVVNVYHPSYLAADSKNSMDDTGSTAGGKISDTDPPLDAPMLQLIHMDSGGGGMEEKIYSNQVAWFNQTMTQTRARYQDHNIPALLFIHIPFEEFAIAYEDFTGTGSSACWGTYRDGVTPTLDDGGLFAAINTTEEVKAVFVGHDHCNDFCCAYSTSTTASTGSSSSSFQADVKELCFGRHSSFGGYNCDGYEKGSRVINAKLLSTVPVEGEDDAGQAAKEHDDGEGTGGIYLDAAAGKGSRQEPTAVRRFNSIEITTYVRLLSGKIIHERKMLHSL